MQQPPSQSLLSEIEDRASRRAGKWSHQVLHFKCPTHDDAHPSAEWDPAKQVWICRACNDGGGFTDLAKKLGIDLKVFLPEGNPMPVGRYSWAMRTQNGDVIEHHREQLPDGKKKMWWTTNGESGLNGLGADELPLYLPGVGA